MNERELLTDTTPFMPPVRILEGLSAADAERRAEGAPHAAEGWPAIEPGSWDSLRERFLVQLERLAAPGPDRQRALDPPLEYPPLAHYTIADTLVHVAMHNAHHLGQVVLLRQQMGLWPPPAGSYTW